MSKRESRYKYWWYPMVVDMIKNYGRDPNDDAELTAKFRKAITQAFQELDGKDNGEEIKSAVNMKYIKATHTLEGVADVLHVSRTTAANMVSYFVYRVAEIVGLKK